MSKTVSPVPGILFPDVVATGRFADEVAWWENDGDPTDGGWTKRSINAAVDLPMFVWAGDMDKDGDIDVAATVNTDDQVLWWENDGTPINGGWTERTVDGSYDAAWGIDVADMDKDGDMDVVASSQDQDRVDWWENDGSPANGGWVQHQILSSYDVPETVHIADIDQDGHPDIVTCADNSNEVTILRNTAEPPPVPTFVKHTIEGDFDGAVIVIAIDLDQDGDIDALGTANAADSITWWENDGSENFTAHNIIDGFDGAYGVFATDIDSDGDLDVLGTAGFADDITWFENDGSENFTERIIEGDFDGAISVYAADVDGDCDVDVIGAAQTAGDIVWWANDGTPSNGGWTADTLNSGYTGASSVYATDLDNDGDVDILGTANGLGDVTWWENDGSENFTEHTIDGDFEGAYSVYTADVDCDGDTDVISAARAADEISWWENDGTPADGGWTKHTMLDTFDGARSAYPSDIDGDGDVDILGAALAANEIVVLENDGHENFQEYTITSNFVGARSVISSDIDGDGDLDLLGAAVTDDEIAWWENTQNPTPVPSWTENNINNSYANGTSVFAIDMDRDGDTDILSTGNAGSNLTWWDNDGSESFTEQVIDADHGASFSALPADIDGDGYFDIVYSAITLDDVSWFKNDGTPDAGWTEYVIDGSLDGAIHVFAGDIDGDGDTDVAAAAFYGNEIVWYENDGTPDAGWSKAEIETGLGAPTCVFVTDLDKDGDIDVLGAAQSDAKILFFENDGSENFTTRTISDSLTGARTVVAADLDDDGDLDVIACGSNAGTINWWENDGSPSDGGWKERLVANINFPMDVFVADMDNDGDLDVLGAGSTGDLIGWAENDGYPADGGWITHVVSDSFDGAWSVYGSDIDQDGDVDMIGAAYAGGQIAWWENDVDPYLSPARYKHSIPRNGFTMIGIPVIVSDGSPTTLFLDDIDSADVGGHTWRLSYWDRTNQKYVRYNDTDAPNTGGDQDPVDFSPGIGYWINQQVVDNCELDITAAQAIGPVNQSKPFQISALKPLTGPARRGLRMLANPFNYPYDWRRTTVFDPGNDIRKTVYEAAQAGWISGYAYVWDRWTSEYVPYNFSGNSAPYMLDPWQGFWFEQLDATRNLRLEFTPATHMISDEQNENEDMWRVRLSVASESGNLTDSHNYFGVDSRSSDEYDFLDAMEYSPNGEKWVQIFFLRDEWEPLADRFSADIRSKVFPDSHKIWQFNVRTLKVPNSEVVLIWGDLEDVPDNYNLYLSDPELEGGDAFIINMRDTSEFRFNTSDSSYFERTFEITVYQTPTEVDVINPSIPTEFGLTAVYPNPFNSRLRIDYGLPEARNISLKVYDLQGRLVDTMRDGNLQAGYYTTSWDSSAFASGSYFIELQSGAEISRRQVLLAK
ncbi:T9SS type A sorting domain-containing protein [Calditrichota bacterium]